MRYSDVPIFHFKLIEHSGDVLCYTSCKEEGDKKKTTKFVFDFNVFCFEI